MASDADRPRRTRRGTGAVTLHDVAKLAGVAPITASRALNTPQHVSDGVRQRVLDAVARTGYVVNRLAGGLASARSGLVAAVVPTLGGGVFAQTMQALDDALSARGLQLTIGQSGYDERREDALVDAIVGRRPDALVLTGVVHSAQARRRLVAAGIPVVETWDLTPTPIDMLVGFSHADVGRRVAEFVHACGRRRAAIVLGDDERAARRMQAFRARAAELGLGDVAAEVVPAPTTLRSGRAALVRLLERDPAIDVVCCTSDLLALGVLVQAHAAGVPVPARLGVVGFGDQDFAADVHPSLTTVQINGAAIGREAARFVLDRLDGRDVGARVVDVGFSIVERESTARPPLPSKPPGPPHKRLARRQR